MANPQVDMLIQELSQILEQNRQKRNNAQAQMQGVEQGRQMAAQQAQQAAYTAGGAERTLNEPGGSGQQKHATSAQLSPSTTSEGRVALAQKYAKGKNFDIDSVKNPYDDYQFLKENDTPAAPPTDAGVLEEQKKRMTQRLMMQRGESGGPLGGAGAAPSPDAAAIDAAGNPDLGSFGGNAQRAMQGADLIPPGGGGGPAQAPPAGWSAEDMAKLNALSQRYPG